MTLGARDRVIDAAFAVAMAGAAWLAVFGHRGLAPCAGFMALAVALRPQIWKDGLALFAPKRLFSNALSTAALAIVLFSVWVAATAFWSPTPGAEWLGLTVLVAALAAGALVYEALNASPSRTRRFAAVFVLTTSAASAALLFEGLTGGYLRDVIPPADETSGRWKDLTALGRGVTTMAPLVFPAMVILRKLTESWAVAMTPLVALFVAAAQFSVFANVAALSAGALAFVLAAMRPKFVAGGLALLFIASLVFAPFIAVSAPSLAEFETQAALPASWEQRIAVWDAAAERALNECMPLGCGADYARTWSAEGRLIDIRSSAIPLPAMPVHPHNVFIQIWLELGLPGVFAMLVAIAAGVRVILKSNVDRWSMAAVCAAAAAAFISVMLEASLWQVWRLAVFALAAFGGAVSYSINKLKQ